MLDLRLSDGGSASGYFKFDNDAAMAASAQGAGSYVSVGLVDFNILVAGGDTGKFPEMRYTRSNAKGTVIRRNDRPGFTVYAFDLTHADGVVAGLVPALRWTTPVDLPTKAGSSVELTTWGDVRFGLANQQCYDCFPQRQGVSGFITVVAAEPGFGPDGFPLKVPTPLPPAR
ncbi:MAG: hypothetical protein JO001_20070 [Alphaproteobacteria bacterium]|nr:hypothetical protein [Alphaproteobacteria bacterium]